MSNVLGALLLRICSVESGVEITHESSQLKTPGIWSYCKVCNIDCLDKTHFLLQVSFSVSSSLSNSLQDFRALCPSDGVAFWAGRCR